MFTGSLGEYMYIYIHSVQSKSEIFHRPCVHLGRDGRFLPLVSACCVITDTKPKTSRRGKSPNPKLPKLRKTSMYHRRNVQTQQQQQC